MKKYITMFLTTLFVVTLGVTPISNNVIAAEMTTDVGLVFDGEEKQPPKPTPTPDPPAKTPASPTPFYKKILPQTGEKSSIVGISAGLLVIVTAVGCFLKFSKKESDAT